MQYQFTRDNTAMVNCEFQRISATHVQCKLCGLTLQTAQPLERIHARCRSRAPADEIAAQQAAVCGGCTGQQQAAQQAAALPSFLSGLLTAYRQAASLAAAAKRLAGDGGRLASEAQQQQRLGKCGPCANRQGAFCQLCGCFLPLKAYMPLERCPKNPPEWIEC